MKIKLLRPRADTILELVVQFFLWAPGGGKLLGAAWENEEQRSVYVRSAWFGLATGCIELKNDSSQVISLVSWQTDGDGNVFSETKSGGDDLAPGQTKKFEYKGFWRIVANPVPPTVISNQSFRGHGESSLGMRPGA